MNSNNMLAIFVKTPVIGTVKTRLQPALTAQQSLILYKAIVEDLLERLSGLKRYDITIFYSPADAGKQIRHWLGNQYSYFAQQGNDLGERMLQAFQTARTMHYEKVILVGSDLPFLDQIIIIQALNSLDGNDIVIGPTDDGGYYLIGGRQPHSALFTGMNWSTPQVLAETIARAKTAKLEIIQLQQQSDIDSFEDVITLWNIMNDKFSQYHHIKKGRTFSVLKSIFQNTAVNQ